jgi:hypothetical protein
LLLASRTYAVIVAVFDPSEGIDGKLVSRVRVFCVLATITVVLPVTVPLVAVTVMVDPGVAVPEASVAVAVPVESVVPVVVVIFPELAANVTATPLTAALLEFLATTLIVAELEPSEGMVAVLVVTVRLATVEVVPVVPVPELLPPAVAKVEPPPHAASDNVATPKTKIEAKFLMFLT